MARGTISSEHPGADGSAMAAFLAAGIGSFAVGLTVILNEAGIFSAPALYGPAGGVSGRTTLAAVAWLVAWSVLHYRWRGKSIAPGPISALTITLIFFGVLFTFPPFWELL